MKQLRPYAGLGLLLVALPTMTRAQTLGQGGDDGISIARGLAALIFCLLLGAGAMMAIKKWNGGSMTFNLMERKARRRLSLTETLRVSSQVQLCLVACDGMDLLLAVSPQGVQMIVPTVDPVSTNCGETGRQDGAGEAS